MPPMMRIKAKRKMTQTSDGLEQQWNAREAQLTAQASLQNQCDEGFKTYPVTDMSYSTGVRHDKGKPRIDLLAMDVLLYMDEEDFDLPTDFTSLPFGLALWWQRKGSIIPVLGYAMKGLDAYCGGQGLSNEECFDYPRALWEMGRVLAYGPDQGLYDARNWEKGMAWSRPYNAAMRHVMRMEMGQFFDESGCLHRAHAATNIMFLAAYEKRKVGTDDRPR